MADTPTFTLRRIAALLLLLGGLLLVGSGALLTTWTADSAVPDCDAQPFVCGLGQLFIAIACVMLLVGIAHFVAWVGVTRSWRWADWLAVALAVTWLLWAWWVPMVVTTIPWRETP